MKALVTLAALLLAAAASVPQGKQEDFGLPELHKIKTATLSPAYGCRSREDFQRGYENTALFLSKYSRDRNSLELLFNGACGSEDYFQSATGGDDMGLIADLGEMSMEKVTAHLAFNTKNIHSFDLYSKFARMVKVQSNHTYAVLVNGSDIRSLFVFTVTGYVPNKRLDLKYAVQEYQIMQVRA